MNLDSKNAVAPTRPNAPGAAVPLLDDVECWRKLPPVVGAKSTSLPNWVRAVARGLPRTAAVMLTLDFVHRTGSPIDPGLRARMRWVVARANRCAYSEAYALADLERAGLDPHERALLTGDPVHWPPSDREPLEFARLLTVAAPTIPDALFASLRARFGEKQVAAMVLLAAYGNFLDRLVLGLNLPVEEEGPLPPLEVSFAPGAFQIVPQMPEPSGSRPLVDEGESIVPDERGWSGLSYEELQARLEAQRSRTPRLPIPSWEEIRGKLPAELAAHPTEIVWSLICLGYIPELAVPWSISTRTMWVESKLDRVFEESLFWVQTRSVECNYCMGHCEMLLEVAGLDRAAIADRTRRLAGADWSAFPPAEQRAYAYACKLSRTPWELTAADYQSLETDFGPEQALAIFWWLCRGLYMTRVSDGFQLPLERQNVFRGFFGKQPATDSQAAR